MEQTVNAPADISADYSFIMDDDSMSGDGIRLTAWRFATSGSIAGTLPL